jgi:hypothetical protein
MELICLLKFKDQPYRWLDISSFLVQEFGLNAGK